METKPSLTLVLENDGTYTVFMDGEEFGSYFDMTPHDMEILLNALRDEHLPNL